MQRKRSIKCVTAWTTLLLLAANLFLPQAAFGFTEISRTSSREQIAEGVVVETIRIQTAGGYLNTYVTTVDLTNPYVKVDTLVGTGGVVTKNQSVTRMAREAGAVAAINADFFQIKENAPIGVTIKSGEMITSPAHTVSMNSFGLTQDNIPVFGFFGFQGTVTAPNNTTFQLSGINKPSYLVAKDVNSDVYRLNMYTPRWGAKSRGALAGLTGTVEMVVENGLVREFRIDQPGTTIPAAGYVLAGHGPAGQFLTANFKVGDQVNISYSYTPETDNLSAAVGGQAILVKDGKRHWFSNNITGDHARTAIGASQDGKTLYMVVVDDGNSSEGMTQEELADFMISIGAWTALNLDGGGSSTLAARHLGDQTVSLINNPAAGSERAVPTALGIFSTAPAGAFAGLHITGPKLMLVGTSKTFTAKGYDEHFNPYAIGPADISWQISPGLGEFQGSTFTAGSSGDAKVTASYNGISQEYPVKILGSTDISKVEVSPATIALNPGDSVNISVKVTTRQGLVFVLQPGEYEVQVKGGVGTVSGSGFTAADRTGVGELVIKIDSTSASVKVSVGGTEKQFYGFETAKVLKFRSYPADQIPGNFRLTTADEPTFRGAGAARLDYDFTKINNTRAAYGSFDGGLSLPGQPLGLGLWVLGDGGNGHWLRARIVDAAGKEKLLDLARNVNWQGWKHVTADIPSDVQEPVKLTDIYLVETAGGAPDTGTVYFDELSVIGVPAPGEQNEPLDSDLELNFANPAGVSTFTVLAKQVWKTDLPTPGYNPVMPFYEITGTADGDGASNLPGPMKIKVKIGGIKDPAKARLMLWDKTGLLWRPVPFAVDLTTGTLTAKTGRLGIFALLEDARPAPEFSDTSASWARQLIADMAAKRIVSGFPEGKFMPGKGVTRAEFVTLLANTLGWEPGSAVYFKDDLPAWAQGSIAAAVARGVVRGYGDGTFQPQKVVTRAEMAVMLDKALMLENSSRPSNYRDAKAIPSWAVQSIRNTKVAGIMQGSDNRFRPKDIANRAEATAVMAKILEFYLQ